NEVVLPAPFGPRSPTTSPGWMSRLTWSTTTRLRKRFRRFWAIRPSMSPSAKGRRASAARRPSGGLAVSGGLGVGLGRLLLVLGVEHRLHALLLAALHHVAVLGQVDRDALAGHHVVVAPDPGIADEQHPLLGVIILGPRGGAHPAVPRDDAHVARRDRPHDVL